MHPAPLILTLLFLAGAAVAQPRIVASPEDAKALTEIHKRWLDAYQRQDIDALAALYAPDAWLMSKDRALLRGRDAIRANFAGMMARVEVEMVDEPEEIEVRGDQAHSIGLFWITGQPKAGGVSFTSAGRYLILFRRGPDGSWKVYRDMDTASPDAARLAPASTARPGKQPEQL